MTILTDFFFFIPLGIHIQHKAYATGYHGQYANRGEDDLLGGGYTRQDLPKEVCGADQAQDIGQPVVKGAVFEFHFISPSYIAFRLLSISLREVYFRF